MKYCPNCRYPNPDNRTTCFQCEAHLPAGLPGVAVPPQHPQSAVQACTCCQLRLLPGEDICPRCGMPIDAHKYAHLPVFNLDHLTGIDRALWEAYEKKATETQIITWLKGLNLDITTHPVYRIITNSMAQYVKCDHLNHDTAEKKAACNQREAAKLTVRTIRHHLGFLKRLQMWHAQSPGSFAVWSCVERHGPACDLCKRREGMIIPVSMRFVVMLHPGCNCSLIPIQWELAATTLANNLNYLAKNNPVRAATFLANLKRCGLDLSGNRMGTGSASATSGCGCGLLSVCGILVFLAALAIMWFR